MKIRNDFVSNSSSSSFIIADSWFFHFFDITKKDICDAIADLHEKSDSIDNNLWQVVDLSNLDERESCYVEWDSHFSEWDAPNAGKTRVYDSVINAFADSGMYEVEYAMHADSDKIPTFYNRKTRKDEPIPDYILKTVKYLREKLGIKTMKEVLHDEHTRFMIHFSDNEVWNLKGMADDDKSFETDSYTTMRFYEVLIDYFINNGKVDLTDKDFIEYWKVPDDHWWKKDDRHKDKTYFLEDQNKVSIREVIETFDDQSIGHEG